MLEPYSGDLPVELTQSNREITTNIVHELGLFSCVGNPGMPPQTASRGLPQLQPLHMLTILIQYKSVSTKT